LRLNVKNKMNFVRFGSDAYLIQVSGDCIVAIKSEGAHLNLRVPFQVMDNLLGDVVVYNIDKKGDIEVDFTNMRQVRDMTYETDRNYLIARPLDKKLLLIRDY